MITKKKPGPKKGTRTEHSRIYMTPARKSDLQARCIDGNTSITVIVNAALDAAGVAK